MFIDTIFNDVNVLPIELKKFEDILIITLMRTLNPKEVGKGTP